MGKLLNIKQASEFLNVTPDCLRKWNKSGKLVPLRTVGGHRRYDEDELKKFIGINNDEIATNGNKVNDLTMLCKCILLNDVSDTSIFLFINK